jgi:hypothetical protein
VTHQPELDAVIVRNIGDIGAAINRVTKDIDPRLWAESGIIVMAAAAAMGWIGHADGAEEAVWLAHADWLEASDDPSDPPFFIELNERAEPGVDADWTWLASFTGAWPNRGTMGFFVGDSRLRHGAWKKQLRGNGLIVDALVARGFRYDGSSGELYVPFQVEAELLAKAFEEDAFEVALEPIAGALAIIGSAHSELSALCRLSTA